ncbi:hypothetical protein [Gimesia aquarii]|uniref:MraY-like glycosyltransferase n=1 Tax=Gimesia aquarii TaxID=2527964 RepID=A0A517WYG7_9PLAN|nr:hypothetical protein [Gimesia aquarii]QDU10295.1 hypothetical protein V202x_36940 [Gimesia aquarii]
MNPDSHMNPDDYQQAWQAHSSQTRVIIDADLLRKEAQYDQLSFRSAIFWRDFCEIGIALLMIPLWFYLGAVTSSPWTWYLTVPVLVWMAGFMLVYRMRHKQKPSQPDEPLLICVKRSVTEVEDQIWLLRNVFWWYLLPPSISIMAFFAQVSWESRSEGWLAALMFFIGLSIFLFALYSFIYYLNKRYVHLQLEPRRQELLTLITSLRDETNVEGVNDRVSLPGLPFAQDRLPTSCTSPARIAIGLFTIVVIMLFLVYMINMAITSNSSHLTSEGYPKISPFAGVRWQESQPEVKLGEEWFKLESLNNIPADEIVAFSQRTYEDLWRKRFEEDLVELLTRMGHPPQDTVTLVVQPLTSSQPQVRKNVPMTKANRRAIREEARKRKYDTSEP